jgi:hypothetical protein
MSVISATEVTIYSNISASAVTIANSGLIDIVQERISMMTNNYFVTDLSIQNTMTFNATARTIIAEDSFDDYNFLAGDDIFIYNSYRNDGVKTIATVSAKTLTLTSTCSVVEELSGRSIMISIIKWPTPVKYAAAQMIAYDYDERGKNSVGITSHSLGPFSESFGNSDSEFFGYPKKITDALIPYRMLRAM